jgi:hypothetical protein
MEKERSVTPPLLRQLSATHHLSFQQLGSTILALLLVQLSDSLLSLPLPSGLVETISLSEPVLVGIQQSECLGVAVERNEQLDLGL